MILVKGEGGRCARRAVHATRQLQPAASRIASDPPTYRATRPTIDPIIHPITLAGATDPAPESSSTG